jgi:sn-1 stearoyl-lipid 9-desaturase
MVTFAAVFLVSYVLHGFGVTIGYHRLLSHRSFRCNKFVEYFWVFWGYLAFEGSPIWWAAIHRAHHKYVDTPLDPHSPRYGKFHSWFGWLLEPTYPAHVIPEDTCKDLMQDKLYLFLDQNKNIPRMNVLNLGCNIAFRGILWAIFGWEVALASILAAAMVMQIPLALNLFCHLPNLGYKNFATEDDGVNVWWVGLLGLGEGWHNNHHAYPGSARNGMMAWEFDASYLTILFMRKLGLVQWLNPGPDLSKGLDYNQKLAAAALKAATQPASPSVIATESEATASSFISSASRVPNSAPVMAVKAKTTSVR